MTINIKATNLELTPDIKAYVEDRLQPLEKLSQHWDEQGSLDMRVEVARTTKHHFKGDVFYAEINMGFPGGNLRAEAKSDDIFAAIDEAHDDIKRQLNKHHTGRMEKIRKGARKIKEWIKGI
jgi:putative sigma-54 modulation protein